jgi:hypothetical protein
MTAVQQSERLAVADSAAIEIRSQCPVVRRVHTKRALLGEARRALQPLADQVARLERLQIDQERAAAAVTLRGCLGSPERLGDLDDDI